MNNSSLDFDFCENYVYMKRNLVSFPSGSKRAKQILELVQTIAYIKLPTADAYGTLDI